MKKRVLRLSLLAACSLPFSAAFCAPQLTDTASIPAVIAAMTLAEKAALVTGTGMNNSAKVAGAAGSTLAIPRLGIPSIVFADGPVGVRLGAGPTGGAKRFATGFPVSIAMAASWDPALIQRVGGAIGREARERGVDLMLGPAINIQRNPRNGRNFEYFSEDPLLNARIAASYIRGLQAQGVGAVVKHFAANNQETRRQTLNQIVSERALREIYFPGFEYAIREAQPWAIMSSYPAINGTAASQNTWLLTQVLRDQWRFNGMVMSDWYGVTDPVSALLAGNDLNMPGGKSQKDTPFVPRNTDPQEVVLTALKSGALTEKQIDTNLTRILQTVVKTQAFKQATPPEEAAPADPAALAREVAADSMVLLKNSDHTLPVRRGQRIAAFGENVHRFFDTGGGSAEVNIDPQQRVSLQEGMRNAGVTFIDTLDKQRLDEGSLDKTLRRAVEKSDIALIAIGRSSTEGADSYTMAVHPDELAMIAKVSAAFHQQNKKVVVLLNIGSPIEIASWQPQVDAILLAWQPGQQGGNAVADILTGKVSPSGKLPLTFPVRNADTPSFGNFPGNSKTVIFGEGIYVGYRYYDTKGIAPAYPFGHGLSYAKIEYGPLTPSSPVFDIDKQQSVTISLTLRNASDRTAKEVVQLYVGDNVARLDRPVQELKAFEKVTLKGWESKTVTLQLDKRAFSYYDEDRQDWVLEGPFTLRIGRSSRDIVAEVPLRVTSATPAYSLDTPWIAIQTWEEAARVVAAVIGDEATNAWITGSPTLGEKLDQAFQQQPTLADSPSKQQAVKQSVLQQINAL